MNTKEKYPHAVTKKCSQCGRVFTCKGEGWKQDWKPFNLRGTKCPYESYECNCEKCHHGESRPEGCEEIELGEVVEFT